MRTKRVDYDGVPTSSEQVWQSLQVGVFSFSTQANQLIFWNLLGTLNIFERRRAMLDILVIFWQLGSAGYWGIESASEAFMQPGKGSTKIAPTFTFFSMWDFHFVKSLINHESEKNKIRICLLNYTGHILKFFMMNICVEGGDNKYHISFSFSETYPPKRILTFVCFDFFDDWTTINSNWVRWQLKCLWFDWSGVRSNTKSASAQVSDQIALQIREAILYQNWCFFTHSKSKHCHN